MGKAYLLLVTMATMLVVSGCRGMIRPSLRYPGPLAYQQSAAEQFDPYPENELGPAVVGGRPREYQKPIPEPLRARRLPWYLAPNY